MSYRRRHHKSCAGGGSTRCECTARWGGSAGLAGYKWGAAGHAATRFGLEVVRRHPSPENWHSSWQTTRRGGNGDGGGGDDGGLRGGGGGEGGAFGTAQGGDGGGGGACGGRGGCAGGPPGEGGSEGGGGGGALGLLKMVQASPKWDWMSGMLEPVNE